MKRSKITLILLVLIAVLVGGFFFLQPSIQFVSDPVFLEKGDTYDPMYPIAEHRGTIIPENDTLYTDDTGFYTFHYTVKNWIFEKEASFSYAVIDTRPPVITIISPRVEIDPEEEYTEAQMKENILIDEGTLRFETDLDPEYAGSYTVNIIATDDHDNTSTSSYTIVVKDTEEPLVLNAGYGSIHKRGNAFDIHDYIAYGDNADPDPLLEVEGEVNIYRLGEYPLHVKLTDASGNTNEWDFTVTVVNDYPDDDDYEREPYYFEDFMYDYEGEGRMFGIDISEWQDSPDFERVKEAGCDFVMMRLGFSHGDKLTLDKEFNENIRKAKEAGLPVGVYLFSYQNNEEDLKKVLDQLFEALGDTQLELPIVFDWEDFWDFQDYKMSFKDLNHLYDVFEQEVTARGYKSMLYSSKYYLQTVWTHNDDHPIWMAQYTDWPSYEGKYQIWQLTDSGWIDGIDTFTDLDIMFEMP